MQLHDPIASARPASWYIDPVDGAPRANFTWPEHGVCVLLDAPGDVSAEVRAADLARDAPLRAAGYRVLRWSAEEFDARGGELVADLMAVLAEMEPC